MKKLLNVELVSNFLLLMFGIFATLFIFLDMFNFRFREEITGFGLLCGAVMTAVYVLRIKSKAVSWLLVGLAAVIWLIAGYRMWPMFLEASQVFNSYITPRLWRIVAYDFPEAPAYSWKQYWDCARLCMYSLVPYVSILTYGIIVSKRRLVTMMLTLPVFGFTYAIMDTPKPWMLVAMFTFWTAVMLKPKIQSGLKSNLASLLGVGLSALFLMTMLLVFPIEEFKAQPHAGEIREQLLNKATDIQSGNFFQGIGGYTGSPLTGSDSSTDLNSTGSLRFPDKDILRVENAEKLGMYLRGYSAGVYTGNSWEQLDSSVLENSAVPENSLWAINMDFETDFEIELFYNAGHYLFSDPIELSVQPLVENSKYIFTPYQITDMDPLGSWTNDAYLADGGNTAVKFGSVGLSNLGDLEVPIKNQCMRMESFSEYLTSSGWGFPLRQGLYYAEDYPVYQSNDVYSMEMNLNGFFVLIPDKSGYFSIGEISENEDFIAMGQQDLQNVEDFPYLRDIKSIYTQLPDGERDMLLDWWLKTQTQLPENLTVEGKVLLANTPYWQWGAVASQVADAIRSSGSYNKNPGRQPMNRDFVEYFLNESSTGYCVHFASATTAMLRAMGIPARYVEGYVVNSALYDTDGAATVPAEAAHAWAEIWLPAAGWVPVESTPGQGLSGTEEPAPELTVTTPEPPTPASQESPEPSTAPESPDIDEAESEAGGSFPAALIVMPLIAALLILARWLAKKYRDWNFHDHNPDNAAIYLYRHLKKLGSFGDYELPGEIEEIAQRAKFSNHPTTAEELEFMRRELESCQKSLRKKLPLPKRLLLIALGLI